MSVVRGGLRISVTGLLETIRGNANIAAGMPNMKTRVLRDSATFFVAKAKDKVHVITGNLGRSIRVDALTPQVATVAATMRYAQEEEDREGERRIPPHTPHPYMAPSAIETGRQMPIYIKKHFQELLDRNKVR